MSANKSGSTLDQGLGANPCGRGAAAWARIPVHLRGGLARFLIHGLRTGDFLAAVLRNDLVGALCRADEVSAANLQPIVVFLYNYVPGIAYGRADAPEQWFLTSQAERLRLLRLSCDDAFNVMLADSGIAFGVPSDGRAA